MVVMNSIKTNIYVTILLISIFMIFYTFMGDSLFY